MNERLTSMSIALVSNFTLVISAMLVYVLLLDGRFSPKSKRYQILIGLSFGVLCFISMHAPIPVREGVIIDAKYPLVGIATIFAGPFAGMIALILAASYRAYMGGIGVYAAVPTLLFVWGLAISLRKGFTQGGPVPQRFWKFLIFGVIIWIFQVVGGLVFLFFLPLDEVGPLLVDRSIPAMMVYPPMTVLLGLSLDFVESRHRLRQAKLEDEARFRMVFESSPLPMAILNTETWDLKQSNAVFQEEFGQSFVVQQKELFQRAKNSLVGLGTPAFREECQYHHGKSLRHISVLVGVVVIEGNDCLLVHLVDRTRDVLAEQVRQRLLLNLERKNKEIQDLNFALHHDLRTPLVSILAFVGELRERIQQDDKQGALDDLGRVEEASQKLSRLVMGISQLNESMKRSNQESECDFEPLVKGLAQRIFLPNSKLVLEGEIIRLPLDERILENLLSPIFENAMQFAVPGKGLVVHAGTKLERNAVHIWVRDNGKGMETKFLERVFSLFEKLDSKSSGIGLGLTLVRRMSESLGGKAWLESEGIGKGCTAHITIPRKEAIFP